MDSDTRAKAADDLLTAYSTRELVEPSIQTYPDIELTDAYQIQLLQIQALQGRGGVIKGHKGGLTSRAMQKQLGVSEPDYGHLLADVFYLGHLPHPHPPVPPALYRTRHRLCPQATTQGARSHDRRRRQSRGLRPAGPGNSRQPGSGLKISLIDTISDSASSGPVVLGSSPTPLAATDLRLTGCTFHRNSQAVGTGAGGAVLGSPLNALVWLANTVGALGVTLEAGHMVLSGAVTALVPVEPAATFAGLGSVTARFARGQQRPPRNRPGTWKALPQTCSPASPRAVNGNPSPTTGQSPTSPPGTGSRTSTSPNASPRGEHLIGVKLGLTSRAKQQRMGVGTPFVAWLTDDMILPVGDPVPQFKLIHPRTEPEIVFVMGQKLDGPG